MDAANIELQIKGNFKLLLEFEGFSGEQKTWGLKYSVMKIKEKKSTI